MRRHVGGGPPHPRRCDDSQRLDRAQGHRLTKFEYTDLVDRVAFVDPAGDKTELKYAQARSAVVAIGQDYLSRIFVLHVFMQRCSTDRLIDEMFNVNELYSPRVFGGEANAMQSIFQYAVLREARIYRGVNLPLLPVHQPTHQIKDFRIRAALQPVIAEGRLFLQPHHHELREEIRIFPQGRTKDGIDALASAVALLPPRITKREESDEIDQIAAYLRDNGTPAWQIEARVRELRAERGLPSDASYAIPTMSNLHH